MNSFIQSDAETGSFQFLEEANNRSERISKMIFRHATIAIVIMLNILAVASISYCWITHGHLDVKYLYNPTKFRFETLSSHLMKKSDFREEIIL